VHQSIVDGGVMKMRPVASLPIESDKPMTLAPGGYHIMLSGLKQALKQGDSFPITLTQLAHNRGSTPDKTRAW